MAKNKGKHKSQRLPKEEPVEELQSLTSRIFQQLLPHAVKIGAVLGGLAVVLAGFAIWSWHTHRRDARATNQFGKVVDTLHGQVVAEEPKDYKPDPDKPPHFKTWDDKTQAALAEAERLSKEYGSSGVAKEASLVQAGLLYDLGRWDDAVAAYKKFLASGPKGELAYVAKEGIGYAIEAKGIQTQQKDPAKAKEIFASALREFEQLDPDEKGAHHDMALYHQARVKALMGDKAGAIQLYKQVLDKYPATPVAAEINNRLAILEEQSS